MSRYGDTDGAVLLAPLIHMNGSSAETLLDGYRAAHDAINAGLDALRACAPNGRDYYPIGDHAFKQAVREHEERGAALRKVLAEIEMIAENIQEQQDARRKR